MVAIPTNCSVFTPAFFLKAIAPALFRTSLGRTQSLLPLLSRHFAACTLLLAALLSPCAADAASPSDVFHFETVTALADMQELIRNRFPLAA